MQVVDTLFTVKSLKASVLQDQRRSTFLVTSFSEKGLHAADLPPTMELLCAGFLESVRCTEWVLQTQSQDSKLQIHCACSELHHNASRKVHWQSSLLASDFLKGNYERQRERKNQTCSRRESLLLAVTFLWNTTHNHTEVWWHGYRHAQDWATNLPINKKP